MKLTERSKKCLITTNNIANILQKPPNPFHLLLSFKYLTNSVAHCVLENLEICPRNKKVDEANNLHLFKNNALEGKIEALNAVVEKADEYKRKMGDNYIGTEHLLLGILDDEEVQNAILPLKPDDVKNEVERLLGTKKPMLTKEEKYDLIEKIINEN